MPGRSTQYTVSIVVPMFNEADGIKHFYAVLKKELDRLKCVHEIIFVDDGSIDDSFEKVRQIAASDASVKGIQFSRNFGHQMALFAGLKMAAGDYIIMMDADLQHPPRLIPELIQHAQAGYDIVYTIRKDDETGFLKKSTSSLFYAVFNFLSGLKICNTADFRLITRKVCDTITSLDERDIFLRGLFCWIGFRQTGIEYKPDKRKYGTTKYTFKKMLRFALIGITSFSIKPIRLSLFLCIAAIMIAVFYSGYALYVKLVLDSAIQGWTSILILNSLFFAGVFMLLGIIGEYIGKIHMETKKRPLYIISNTFGDMQKHE
ncbi:MAG: glycosyltransferase family 2 protein [Candidatus Auribacterota bacterium]